MKRVEALRAKDVEKQAEEEHRVQEKIEKRKQRDNERRKAKRQEMKAGSKAVKSEDVTGQKRKVCSARCIRELNALRLLVKRHRPSLHLGAGD